MTPQSVALMAEYNRWMNQRMYDAALSLSDAEVMLDRGAFFGSIFQTLNHIAVGDTVWLHRFAQHEEMSALRSQMQPFVVPTSLREALAPSLQHLRTYRQALDEVIEAWAGALTPEQLASRLTYRNMAGQPSSRCLGHLILHFFNHQTHHRGQVSTLLFQAGVDVGMTDLLGFIPHEP